MSEDIYTQFGIDKSRLKRDYIANPLKRRYGSIPSEKPEIEDVKYLYNELNLTIKDVAKVCYVDRRIIRKIISDNDLEKSKLYKPTYDEIYNCYIVCNMTMDEIAIKYGVKKRTIQYWLTMYNIYKPKDLFYEMVKRKNLEKYGETSFMKTNNGKKKYIESLNKIYGVNNLSQLDWVQKKKKLNCKERTGYDWYSQIPEFRKKVEETNIKKYGYNCTFVVPKYKELINQTVREKYGVDNVSQNEYIKRKKEETCLKHYGAKYYAQTVEGKDYFTKWCLTNYGVPYYPMTNEFKNLWKDKEFVNKVQEKIHNTMLKNGTAGKSKEEDKIYEMLCEKFEKVERQYKSELYSYFCDFYIPSIDTYIEYQGFWKHGSEPYIGNEEQLKIIETWKQKSLEINYKNKLKNEYLDAISRWTKKDVEKRECARKNNLNWIEFFNMKEFIEWYNNQ